MTHRDLLNEMVRQDLNEDDGHPYIAPCGGRLTIVDTFVDEQFDEGPRLSPRYITVYQCGFCNFRISVARRVLRDDLVELKPRILNVYSVPSPRQLVKDLAAAWELPERAGIRPGKGLGE